MTRQLEAAQDPHVTALTDALRAVERQQRQQRNLKRMLEQERAYLSSIQAASGEQLGKDLVTKSPSASDAAAVLAFLDESLLKNSERDQQADDAHDALEREADRIHRELARFAQAPARQETLAWIDVTAPSAGPFRVELLYRVPGATWQPSYEARATTQSDAIELGSSALVRQQTGEAWDDVSLTLSTAKPALSGSMPELQPWKLKPWEPVIYAGSAGQRQLRSKIESRDGALNVPASPAKRVDQEAQLARASVETAGASVTFRLPQAATIPSDWQPHKVSIGATRLRAKLAYEATPTLLPYAFLRAKVTNETESLDRAGPVAVFLDGAFVATAALKQVAPKEDFDLYLGVDERVKIERKPLKERVDVSLLPGLRGKMKSTDDEWLTTVENFTGRRISVLVFDHVPVSEREEIIVESVRYVPSEIEQDKEKPGVFHWTLDLGPSQKQELRLVYRVRHPVDMQLQ